MGSVNRPERLAAGIAAHVCDVSYGLPALNKSDETAAPPPPYPDGRFLRRCTLALITIPSHADHGASVADPVAREVPALGRSPRTRDRQSAVEGKIVSERVDLGGRRNIKKKKSTQKI